jgi:tRNA threonylcarbamoyl adenosine modification protein (Sua5/YciO/YrdC/YwlC family)
MMIYANSRHNARLQHKLRHQGEPLPAELLKINSSQPEANLISYAADRIRRGQVLGMPTDTFYGLAADPVNLRAVDRIYEIKNRSRHKPLSLLVESVDQALELSRNVPEVFHELAEKFWPGPLTIIVKASSRLPLKVTANTGNVALRVPSAAIPVAIIRETGFPITATSASLVGSNECTTAESLREQLGDRISIIVNGGPTERDVPTTIVDLSGDPTQWQILREGAIPSDDLSQILWK